MKTNKLSRSVYKEKCATAFKLVSELCKQYERYAAFMHYDEVLDSFSIRILPTRSGIITRYFLFDLDEKLDSVHIIYDYDITSSYYKAVIEIDLLHYERK